MISQIGKITIAMGVSEPTYWLLYEIASPGPKLHWDNHNFKNILKTCNPTTFSSGNAFYGN